MQQEVAMEAEGKREESDFKECLIVYSQKEYNAHNVWIKILCGKQECYKG